MKTLIDLETTRQRIVKRSYPLPFDSRNKLVTFQYYREDGKQGIYVLNHKEKSYTPKDIEEIQTILNEATLLIGHNLKFDVMWLRECGFKVKAPYYDTMLGEYIRSKGMKLDLSLRGSALRLGLTPKLDILEEYWQKGINTDEIPLSELTEYALGDLTTTWELYQYHVNNPIECMKPVIGMSNEFLDVLIEMERHGTFIDTDTLNGIAHDYVNEHKQLEDKLISVLKDVMGDTPLNLSSPEQLSQVIYSRKVKDKRQWKEIFNIGSEIRNSVVKKKQPYVYSESQFVKLVRENTDKVYKTEVTHCVDCNGEGSIRKIKKDGTEFKKNTVCKSCSGTGCIYISTGKIAGFKVTPASYLYAADGGFSTSKKTLEQLLQSTKIRPEVKDFIKIFLRYGAIESYLTSFIDGIKNNIKANDILHVNFNQCVTATGRLSSSNPNFQNLPRDKTFPIRRVVKSRWEGGSILDCDLAQLEFRVAAILADDKIAKQDILNGVDVHAYTAKILSDSGQPTNRQDAKSHTFKPLYGGTSGSDAERTYYTAFLDKYNIIREWHKQLSEEAISTKRILSRSGRIYSFPNATRQKNGKSSQFTQIVNYCVQGFATGDITPCIMIELQKEITKLGLNSLLILTVHDSVTADVYPGEEDVMIQVFKKVFDNIPEILYNRFKLKLDIPIGYELSIGDNWSNKRKVS